MGDLPDAGRDAGSGHLFGPNARATVKHDLLFALTGQFGRIERMHRQQKRPLNMLKGILLNRAHVDQDDLVAPEGGGGLFDAPGFENGIVDGFGFHVQTPAADGLEPRQDHSQRATAFPPHSGGRIVECHAKCCAMVQISPHISESQPTIRQLDDAAINRIAAGEVVERPASAVKELVENALDAGARRIAVDYADGGKTLIRVIDDGCGMSPDDLPLALSRHATSKIDGSDLLNIHTFGFRGEALPSLGAVGRLAITSRAEGHEGAQIEVSGGTPGPVRPAAAPSGTRVELRDIFHATPARLKFMRTDRAEMQAITDVVKRLAMAEPHVSVTLADVSGGGEGRVTFRAEAESGDMFTALHGGLARILGRDFAENALPIDATREGITLTGFAALPTYSRGSAVQQFLFVNERPVRD